MANEPDFDEVNLELILGLLQEPGIQNEMGIIKRLRTTAKSPRKAVPTRRQMEFAKRIVQASDEEVRNEILGALRRFADEMRKVGRPHFETSLLGKADLDRNQIEAIRQAAKIWIALYEQSIETDRGNLSS